MSMNRVINDPDLVVDDMLDGWLLAHAESVAALPTNPRVVQRVRAPEHGKVGVVTGGGSGHEPALLGYVGDGMVDAVVAGEIFMWKVGAAKAALGGSLDEAIAAAQKAIANTRGIGVALSACVIPAVGKANFHIEQARIGRSGRLGPRSIGVLDAGAASCCLILQTLGPSLQRQLVR